MPFEKFDSIALLHGKILTLRPGHNKFLRKSLEGYSSAEIQEIDALARKVILLAGGDLEQFVESYLWLCDEVQKETLYFRRHGTYRLSTFAQANAEVYANRDFMKKYLEGILISQVVWRNHSAAFLYFKQTFLSRLSAGYHYLEVGPGHGLFLSMAAEDSRSATVSAWDVSEESLSQTKAALAKMALADNVELTRRDILDPEVTALAKGQYDAIAFCEVLEHLERPKDALASLRDLLSPDGLLYVNVPLNSPAPDHIFLLKSEDEVRDLITSAGLSITDLQMAPMTGYDLPTAIERNATVSCFILAKRR